VALSGVNAKLSLSAQSYAAAGQVPASPFPEKAFDVSRSDAIDVVIFFP